MLSSPCILAASALGSRVVIYLLGLAGATAALWGAIKFASLARRKGMNKNAALAVAAICAALVIPCLTAVTGQLLADVIDQPTALSLIYVNAAILMLVFLLTAIVLALLALVEIKDRRNRLQAKGRRLAIVAMLSSG